MNILLSSVGRRPYLVRWFQEALDANGIHGRVIAADLDIHAPARAFADIFVPSPRVDDETYEEWLASTLATFEIDLAVSINDFELSEWAVLPRNDLFAPLVRVTPETQRLVEDKFAMSHGLARANVRAPQTWLGGGIAAEDIGSGSFVTKGRFGSASRGLRFANASELNEAIDSATHEVTDRQGIPAYGQSLIPQRDLVVVQERIDGTEYGLDVVCDLDGRYAAVIAREKITMRAGETDRAISVDSGEFESVARGIAEAVPHPGTFDIDVIVGDEGLPYVIDINPRFGGGYPLSHVAGARVPSAYVAWKAGHEINPEWLRSRPGVTAGKYVEAVAILLAGEAGA